MRNQNSFLELKGTEVVSIDQTSDGITVIIEQQATVHLPELGGYLKLTIDSYLFGEFFLEQIFRNENGSYRLSLTDIIASLLNSNLGLKEASAQLTAPINSIGGTGEGSINYYNSNPASLICFPAIGYKKWPNTTPTNLTKEILPPAVRLYPLLESLLADLGITLKSSPALERLLLPYLLIKPLEWPYDNLASLSFEWTNTSLNFNSILASVTDASTSSKRVVQYTFLESYALEAQSSVTFQNNGSALSTGLVFWRITDPSLTLIKAIVPISFSLAPGGTTTQTVTLQGTGIKGDVLSLHIEPDISLSGLQFTIEASVTPQQKDHFNIADLLPNITLGSLLKSISLFTGLEWQTNAKTLELTIPKANTCLFESDSFALQTNFLSELDARQSKLPTVNSFPVYIKDIGNITKEINLLSTKNNLQNSDAELSYAMPFFLVSALEPEVNSPIIKVENYPVTLLLPEIIVPFIAVEAIPKRGTIIWQGNLSVPELGKLLNAQTVGFPSQKAWIKTINAKPIDSGFKVILKAT